MDATSSEQAPPAADGAPSIEPVGLAEVEARRRRGRPQVAVEVLAASDG